MKCARMPMARACATTPAWYLSASETNLPEACAVFLQDTQVHHNEDSRFASFLSGFLVDDIFLHPDCGNFQFDCLIDNLFYKFGPAKNIDDVDFLRHVRQRGVCFLAKTFVDLRIDGNDAIAVALHVG